MGEHFLQWINIVDFKCFHNFEAKDFKRVNLISGKNNVGKTAFMEACFINVHTQNKSSFADAIVQTKYSREKLNLCTEETKNLKSFLELAKVYLCESNLKKTDFRFVGDDAIKEYMFNINNDISIINVNDFSLSNTKINIQFMDNYGFPDNRLANYYAFIQEQDKEPFLNQLIQSFDPSIESFKVIGDKPQCKYQGEYIDLTEFGDGLKHYISIICALYACENGQLFIDEIDNGIHYTQLDNLWELILNISKEVNCQVFATTHSKECIESYARIAKKLEDEEITYTILSRLKNGEIHAGVRNFELLENSISQEHEIR
jgi:AAA15 family ATPase/GTPase